MMQAALSDLGSGVLLAWLALPLLALTIARAGRVDPASQFRAIATVLALASAVIALPFAREAAGLGATIELPKDVAHELLAAREPISARWPLAPSLLGVLAIAWIAAASLAAVRGLAGGIVIAGVARRAEPAPRAIVARLAAIAGALEVTAPRVRLTDECAVPFTAGALRPVIVLPRAVAATFEPHAIDLILRHELAHVARRDALWSALLEVPRALFALHPTARGLFAELRLARELAVDARVSSFDPAAYPKVLLDVACHARFGRRLYDAIGMHRTDLAERLEALGDESPRRPARVVAAALVATALAASAVAAPRLQVNACSLHRSPCHDCGMMMTRVPS